MSSKIVWSLGMLASLALATAVGAQQQQNYPQSQGGAAAQTNSQHATAPRPENWPEERVEPYHKHRDTRHGHDQLYPDRGSVVREAPRASTTVNYAGVSYRFAEGVWYEPRGPAFIVVAPPIGLMVPALPGFATAVVSGGENYLYANDVYYRARPEVGGYEGVN